MKNVLSDCCVLNGGSGSWAFEKLAERLAAALGIPIGTEPRRFNYLLNYETVGRGLPPHSFIPPTSIDLAADKRLLAAAFADGDVLTPKTFLFDTYAEVVALVGHHPESEWCLKYPTSCGANGHRTIVRESPEPPNWPRPFILQEFIRLERPEVYRVYGVGGELFGWVVRRFPPGQQPSPWVAHARGARYEVLAEAPPEALAAAHRALQATGLLASFGCADLLRRPSGEWVILEVGTDGLVNHVDRELGAPSFEAELSQRIARAFWHWVSKESE